MEANKKCSNGLPCDNSVYNKKEYWDQRYTHEREFDWLGDFSGFKDLFLSHAPLSAYRDAKILILGCGNSALGRQLFDAGYRDVTNSDYSEVCIDKQEAWHRTDGYKDIKWEVIDMTNMAHIKDGEYSLVVEKATIDAFYVEEASPWRISAETAKTVDLCLNEISRILCPRQGKFISLSFTPARFRMPVLARPEFRWDILRHTFDNGGLPYSFYCMDRAKGTLSPSLLEELKCLMGQGVKIEDRRPSASSSSDEEDFERASRLISGISISSSEDESDADESNPKS